MTMLTGFPTRWNGVSVIVRQSCSGSLWAAGFQTGLYRCPFFDSGSAPYSYITLCLFISGAAIAAPILDIINRRHELWCHSYSIVRKGKEQYEDTDIIYFLAFLLLICSGCSRNTAGSTLECSEQAENELRESGGHDSVETTKLVNGESWHLAQRTIDLPKNMQTVTAQCVDGERIYIGGYTDTGVALCKIDIDGNVLLEYSLPEEISDIYAIAIYQKALYCLVNLTQSTVTSDSQINRIQVITFSEQGVAGEKVVLPKECQESFPYKQLIVDENEYYLLADTTAFKVNRNDLAATCIYQDSPQDGSLEQESFFAMTLFGNKLLLLSTARFSRNCRILCVDTYGLSIDEIYTLHEQPLYSFGKMLDGRPIISHSNKGTAQMSILDIDSRCFNILMRWEDVGAPIQMTWVEETDFGYVFFQQNEHRIQSLQWIPGEKML